MMSLGLSRGHLLLHALTTQRRFFASIRRAHSTESGSSMVFIKAVLRWDKGWSEVSVGGGN